MIQTVRQLMKDLEEVIRLKPEAADYQENTEVYGNDLQYDPVCIGTDIISDEICIKIVHHFPYFPDDTRPISADQTVFLQITSSEA